jgi:energy-coupling factor transport system permease protein
MSALYDLYEAGGSWLHRLDPRVKALLAVCGCAVALAVRNLWLILAGLTLVLALLRSAGISRQRVGWVLRMTAPTMAMIALFWVLLYRGEGKPWLSWWIVHVTPANLAEGLAVALRIGLLALTIFSWLFTTDQADLTLSVVALGLPYSWSLTLAMSLRFLPTMASAFRMVSDAQQARALNLSQGNLFRRARNYIPITVAMLISALRTAQSLSFALESRALGARRARTYLRRLRFRRTDWAALAIVLATTALLLWARVALGLGAHPLRLWL